MDLNDTRKLLDSIAGSMSDYEFTNMHVEQGCSFQRQLEIVLRDKERITAEIDEIESQIEMERYRLTFLQDERERELATKVFDASSVMQSRKLIDLKADLQQVDSWLAQHSFDDLLQSATEYEKAEGEHWSNLLGKMSALEVLADDKVSGDTMNRMSQLPIADYRKAVQIMSQYAEFIKSTTVRAEQQMLNQQAPGIPQS